MSVYMMIFGAIVAALNDLAFNMKVKTKMSLSCPDIQLTRI